MFYDVFCELSQRKGVKPTRAALDMGLSKAAPAKWKSTGATPGGDTLALIAAYFGVSIDYLLGTKQAGNFPGAMSIEDMLSVFSDSETFMLDGKLASPQAAEYLKNSLEAVLEQAKKINEQTNE